MREYNDKVPSKFTPATDKTVAEVLRRLADYCDLTEYNEDRKVIAGEVNSMLDELNEADFFGTEGQCDPRGDRRD